MVFFVSVFMAQEPQNKSRGGRNYITDTILPAVMEDIKIKPQPGKYFKNGVEYEILNTMNSEQIFKECQKQFESYYDSEEDSYIYLKKIQINENSQQQDILARIKVKRDYKIYFYSFINSKKSIVFLTIIFLAFTALYFIFSSYSSSLKADVESQKYQSLQKLARGLAHEIRNPLNAIHLSLQLIGDSDGGKNESDFANAGNALNNNFNKPADKNEIKECLDIIKDEIKRLDETVTRFMQYSKDIILHKDITDIDRLIDKAVKINTPVFEQKKARVEFIKNENAGVKCNADEALLYQVILNILKNAGEAVSDGGLIKIKTGVENNMIVINIANNGPEIKEKYINKIFDFYFTTKIEGSGIGLALSKKIIEAHDGEISVKSGAAETEFTVKMPA
jgi:signal transduction histidine kinase